LLALIVLKQRHIEFAGALKFNPPLRWPVCRVNIFPRQGQLVSSAMVQVRSPCRLPCVFAKNASSNDCSLHTDRRLWQTTLPRASFLDREIQNTTSRPSSHVKGGKQGGLSGHSASQKICQASGYLPVPAEHTGRRPHDQSRNAFYFAPFIALNPNALFLLAFVPALSFQIIPSSLSIFNFPPNFNGVDRPGVAGPSIGVSPDEAPYWAKRQGTGPYPTPTTAPRDKDRGVYIVDW
jgi:hypothetical protein